MKATAAGEGKSPTWLHVNASELLSTIAGMVARRVHYSDHAHTRKPQHKGSLKNELPHHYYYNGSDLQKLFVRPGHQPGIKQPKEHIVRQRKWAGRRVIIYELMCVCVPLQISLCDMVWTLTRSPLQPRP
eukprot:GHVU01025506.1.p1 GENE.GHVU01025506.1~~GHVU01025506.1.p1  ORF type:complete len:130 (+),score=1.63 GHVU01025506.1:206-595(+)